MSTVAPYAAGAAVTGGAFLLFKGSFADEIATHFTLDGAADGFHSPGVAFGLYLTIFGIEAVGSGAALLSVKGPRTGGSVGAFSWGLSAATAYFFVVVMQASTDLQGGAAELPPYQLAIAVVAGLVAGGAAWLIGRRRA
ncbi:hypothetical protein [Streptomyces sp. E2N166]|uniref:hypothetical protein n=1 Tax=Streptomyces sp. E2N166 TaxID=1851909 RepID=UPI001291F33B|nr:hypothetical protein [Streptomyces sp. E2N166]